MITTTKPAQPCDAELWVMAGKYPSIPAQLFIDVAREILNKFGAGQAAAPVSAEPIDWLRVEAGRALVASRLKWINGCPERLKALGGRADDFLLNTFVGEDEIADFETMTALGSAPVAAQAQPTTDGDILDSRKRILDAALHWAECRDIGPSPAKTAWRDLELRVQAELNYTRSIANEDAQAQQPEPPAGFVPVAAFDRLEALCQSQAERLLAIDDAQQPVSGADEQAAFEAIHFGWRAADVPHAFKLWKKACAWQRQAALAQQDADKVDAERYRFIRDGEQVVWCSSSEDCILFTHGLDAAIDAARKEQA